MDKKPVSGGRHALVIGGSIGGLFAGILLRRAGWRVTVFERSRDELASRGAGPGITQELIAAMRRCGAHLNTSVAVDMNSFVAIDRRGRITHELPRRIAASTWSRIYLPLRQALPDGNYRSGMMLERIEQEPAAVTAIFADGTRIRGELLVAADGNQSTVRRQLLPHVQPRYAGYVAWRGIMEERDIPSAIHRDFFDKITFAFPDGELALAMPVPGQGDDMRPGHRRYYFIWYRPTEGAAMEALCTDAEGISHGTSIPPPLIRREFIRDIRDRADAIFAPNLAAVIRRTARPLLQPIFDLEAPRLVIGRTVLMGDAAFIARPHVAAGTAKAALDATRLAEALTESDGDIDAALLRYETMQHRFGSQLVGHARHLGAYLEGQLKPAADRRGDEIRHDPPRLMREYGAPHLVHDFDARELTTLAPEPAVKPRQGTLPLP